MRKRDLAQVGPVLHRRIKAGSRKSRAVVKEAVRRVGIFGGCWIDDRIWIIFVIKLVGWHDIS